MKFTRDQQAAVTIRNIDRGTIRVGNESCTGRIVLTQDAIVRDWVIPDIDQLSSSHAERIVKFAPEIVLLGTGWRPQQPPNEFLFTLARAGVGLEAMETGAACRTFNILVAEGRQLVALLQLD